ncbi:shikimate dehydrogenase family protein [Amycolatopsis sacchari]|uniref:shikimate dehydrogenase family protein n=1 Tax=Amycolatopsis sacchari TaxID=115433 RepID=UPI003D75E799
MTVELPEPAQRPTLYFIGVTTKSSSIRTVFPRWAGHLGLDAVLEGIDLPVHAPAADYRRVVEFLAADELGRGALVTTHKLDLFAACGDLFTRVDPLAELMHETSCLSKPDGGVVAHAKDPISSGLAVDAILPAGYWEGTGADAFVMGAGGSAIAITWYLSRPGKDRPRRIVVSDPDPARLEALLRVHADAGTDLEIETVVVPSPGDNDRVLTDLAPGSFVVNATGLGKDAPGSPLTGKAVFPADAVAWDLNYRGELVFLDQARAAGHVRVHDGWVYFLHGWTQVIAEVFGIEIATEGSEFEALSELASGARR